MPTFLAYPCHLMAGLCLGFMLTLMLSSRPLESSGWTQPRLCVPAGARTAADASCAAAGLPR